MTELCCDAPGLVSGLEDMKLSFGVAMEAPSFGAATGLAGDTALLLASLTAVVLTSGCVASGLKKPAMPRCFMPDEAVFCVEAEVLLISALGVDISLPSMPRTMLSRSRQWKEEELALR